MLAALFILLLPVVGAQAGDEAQAAVQLARVQEAFRLDPHSSWQPDSVALIARWPGTSVATRTCLWLGAIALEQGRGTSAHGWFEEALRRAPGGELAVLARRGLGDIDYRAGRFGAALAEYRAARIDAGPVLRVELDAKIRAAKRERIRFAWEVLAWALVAGCGLNSALRLRGRSLRLPAETWFLLPVYAIFVAAAWRRDPQLRRALIIIATGSLGLVSLALAGGRRRGRAGVVDAMLLVGASLALIYVALQRAGMVTLLLNTLYQTG